MFPEIAQLHAWRKVLSPGAFNQRFRGLRLRTHQTVGLASKLHTRPDEPGELPAFNALWESAPVGTKVSWQNTSPAARSPFDFEHAIKRRADGPADLHTYDAFPLGFNLTEATVKRELAEQAPDFPKSYVLTLDAIGRFERVEASLQPLHGEIAKRVGQQPHPRIPAEVFANLRSDVADRTYATRHDYQRALFGAGVPSGFVGILVAENKEEARDKEVFATTTVDERRAAEYVERNIQRNDLKIPKIIA